MKHMTNYFIKILIIALITLLSAGTINFVVDPAHIFDDKREYEQGIADLIVKGHNVANIVNYDERITQKLIIKQLDIAPDVIVLGSSRALQIRSSNFPEKTFLNHAVSGGTIEDHMAIYEMYHDRSLLPKHVIIGADPWVLNKNNGQTRWQSIKDYFDNITSRLNLRMPSQEDVSVSPMSNKYLQLISYAYLEESIKFVWGVVRRGNRIYFSTSEKYLDSNVKLSDGSLVYGVSVRKRSHDEVMLRAVANAKRGAVYSLGGFTELDGRTMRSIDLFIQSMTAEGVKVTIFLPPYHPSSYQIMLSNTAYSTVSESENYFRQLAADRGINVIGSYDGASLGCNADEFTDDMHPTVDCIARIINY